MSDFHFKPYDASKHGKSLAVGPHNVRDIECEGGKIYYLLGDSDDHGYSIVIDPNDPTQITVEYIESEEEQWEDDQQQISEHAFKEVQAVFQRIRNLGKRNEKM